ncbi:hypothetical protein G647_06152 [Cladophialophora carrionii CBS 160.54]|uniref:Impact N-terminal domain-containing protein n=1 Tax=Cladophialophora carrionii CBS 160.54 TaxID=1279043 RepID=V9D5Z4_9EURO|nr:uncharacterized protein G647_06152 [Cladophialophora carrionii CBS 160.54]ETI22081.1 hypothetical protein G647_06152 [Cladophialophora carrionii CBS 160.54]
MTPTSTASNPKKRRLLYSDDDRDDDDDDNNNNNSHRQKDKHTNASSQSQSQTQQTQIFISSVIQDRKSTFQAHFHPGSSVFAPQGSTYSSRSTAQNPQSSSTTTIIKSLQSHPSFSTASHRIVAWRRRSTQQTLQLHIGAGGAVGSKSAGSTSTSTSTFTTGSDDDGEKYAGRRLEAVLSSMQVEGVIVVARWYGGVMLGPVRFTHIENCAREAIRMWVDSLGGGRQQGQGNLVSGGGSGGSSSSSKKARVDGAGDDNAAAHDQDDEAERTRLANQLLERDNSIVVLRGLLADMTKGKASAGTVAGTDAGTGTGTGTGDIKPESSPAPPSTTVVSSPAKKLEYTDMPLARLKQLEKARDATIAFILRQLDKVEEEQKARGTDTDTDTDTAIASKEQGRVEGDG